VHPTGCRWGVSASVSDFARPRSSRKLLPCRLVYRPPTRASMFPCFSSPAPRRRANRLLPGSVAATSRRARPARARRSCPDRFKLAGSRRRPMERAGCPSQFGLHVEELPSRRRTPPHCLPRARGAKFAPAPRGGSAWRRCDGNPAAGAAACAGGADRAREAAADPAWYLEAAAYLVEALERSPVEDFCIENVDRPAQEVAADALRLAGWLGEPAQHFSQSPQNS
jgi:hypothetical protein